MKTIQTTYFKKPLQTELIRDVWDLWLDGFNYLLIAQACKISTKKVSVIIKDDKSEISSELKKRRRRYE